MRKNFGEGEAKVEMWGGKVEGLGEVGEGKCGRRRFEGLNYVLMGYEFTKPFVCRRKAPPLTNFFYFNGQEKHFLTGKRPKKFVFVFIGHTEIFILRI